MDEIKNRVIKDRVKTDVKVYSVSDEWGNTMPELIVLDDVEYPVTDASYKPMGTVRRYRVTTPNGTSYLYYAPPRWYVMRMIYEEEKTPTWCGDTYRHPPLPGLLDPSKGAYVEVLRLRRGYVGQYVPRLAVKLAADPL